MNRFLRRLLTSLCLTSAVVATTHAQPSTSLGGFYLADFLKTPADLQLTYVRALIEQNSRYGMAFENSDSFYQERLVELAQAVSAKQDPFAQIPLATHFASVAVVHCDWKNDFEKLEFAEKYLGEEKIARYGQIFPEAVAKLRENCPGTRMYPPLDGPSSTATAE